MSSLRITDGVASFALLLVAQRRFLCRISSSFSPFLSLSIFHVFSVPFRIRSVSDNRARLFRGEAGNDRLNSAIIARDFASTSQTDTDRHDSATERMHFNLTVLGDPSGLTRSADFPDVYCFRTDILVVVVVANFHHRSPKYLIFPGNFQKEKAPQAQSTCVLLSLCLTYRHCTALFIARRTDIMLKLLVLGRTNDVLRMRIISLWKFRSRSISLWLDLAPIAF